MQSNIQQIVNRFETSNKRNLSEHNIISTLALFLCVSLVISLGSLVSSKTQFRKLGAKTSTREIKLMLINKKITNHKNKI